MTINKVVSCQCNFYKNILSICDFIDIFKMSFFFGKPVYAPKLQAINHRAALSLFRKQ